MKQVLQNLNTGDTIVEDVPAPAVAPNGLLVATRMTLVSAGTERMLLSFGRANLIEKARQQPEKVRAVFDKARTDGILPTIETVRRRLDEPLPMGYCNVGTVLEVGAGVIEFAPGDLVVSNGKHAEIVSVPQLLCARVPRGVDEESATFTVIGAIALQALRVAAPTIGETFCVLGLGLVGLLAVQLLRANGVRVIAFDYDARRVELALRFGAEAFAIDPGVDVAQRAVEFARGRGVDGVIVAAATASNEPVHQAATMCRKRGRIVLVGVVGLDLVRADFYEKELTFTVSCSYGPGRYDRQYEEQGIDYPLGFVRWTAQRNFEAVLDLFASRSLDVAPLVTHRFPFARAIDAYGVLGGDDPSLGILLDARDANASARNRTIELVPARTLDSSPPAAAGDSVAFIGAGKYASGTLLPAFHAAGARFSTIACSSGVSGAINGRRFGFKAVTTDVSTVFEDRSIDTIVVATRHDSHAEYVIRALLAGKNVFVEKPVALTRQQLDDIVAAYDASRSLGSPSVMVGFNRRFAPHVVRAHELLRTLTEPKSFVLTVNAGAIPADHWTQDALAGGGRVVGEACHFIDLLRFLADAPIANVRALPLTRESHREPLDKLSIELSFTDGSIGTIHYFSNGHRSYPKERLEVFGGGRILQLSNYREFRSYGWPGAKSMRSWVQDKGQRGAARAFLESLRLGAPSPIAFEQIVEVARATFDAADAARAAR